MNINTAYSIQNRKIDPDNKPATKPDGTPNDNDRIEIGPTDLAFSEWAEAGLEAPNLLSLRQYRYDRLLGEMQKRGYGALLVTDPLNIRYATDSTNMQLWNCLLYTSPSPRDA